MRYCHSWRYQAVFATRQGIKEKYIYIYIYIHARSINSRDYTGRSSSFLVCSLWFRKKKRVYFRPLTSLRVYSNRFLVLRNHTGMVVPRSFHSCWKLLTFDQIQLDAYCAVVWRRFEATFKLRPVNTIFERNEMTECPRKPRQPASIRITWHIQPFSTQSARSVSYRFFFCSYASSRFSSQGTDNSMRRTVFFESEHAKMSGHFSVWIMWTGNNRDVFWSAETFQSLAPFSSFILGFFCFLTGHSPSMRNWIMGSLAVIGCWFAVSHCAFNNTMTTSNTLLCHHVYIWSDCGHADSLRKVPRSLLHNKHRSESVYPHNFRLVTFGKRSYVDRRKNDIASGSIAINLIGSISFHFVQAHCLAWAFLRSPCLFFPLGPFWRIPCCSCYPAQLDWFEWRLWCLWFVGCIPGRP